MGTATHHGGLGSSFWTQHLLALLNRGFDPLDKYYGTELPVFITQGPEKAVISEPRLALCLKTFRQTDLPTGSPLTF